MIDVRGATRGRGAGVYLVFLKRNLFTTLFSVETETHVFLVIYDLCL